MIRLSAAWRNTSVRRTIGMAPLAHFILVANLPASSFGKIGRSGRQN
jgi:hypothetical protein